MPFPFDLVVPVVGCAVRIGDRIDGPFRGIGSCVPVDFAAMLCLLFYLSVSVLPFSTNSSTTIYTCAAAGGSDGPSTRSLLAHKYASLGHNRSSNAVHADGALPDYVLRHGGVDAQQPV